MIRGKKKKKKSLNGGTEKAKIFGTGKRKGGVVRHFIITTHMRIL